MTRADFPHRAIAEADARVSETRTVGTLPWRFHVVAEIADFAGLRRRLGRAGSSRIASDLVDASAPYLPGVTMTPVGRERIELDFGGTSPRAADDILDRLRRIAAGREIVLRFGTAIGSAQADEVRLAEQAEAALDRARGANAAGDPPGTPDAIALGAELARAIDENELVLFYQPKVHARRQEIDSAEALIRWQHPVRGLIPPGDFIPVAEAGDLIDRLTLWTIERAIADQLALRAMGHDLRIFVNISGRLLGDTLFAARVCDIVGATDAKLGFEVTETSVIRDPASAIANLQRFADIGVCIAIDDYGAGLSSLAYLKQLPARELKIDKLFITQLTSSNRDPLIVRSTIDLAHALDMEVVAEGVETHAALALLTVMGCDMVQGFLISRPVPRDALVAFLREDGNRRASMETRLSFSRLASAWKRA